MTETVTETMFLIARGVAIVVRDGDHLQFGLDATRAGIIATPHAETLAEIFNKLHQPVTRDWLVGTIAARTATDRTTAGVLVDDLIAFRILAPQTRDSVYVLGHSPLARALCSHLNDVGFSVRRPMRHETDVEFIGRVPPPSATVLVDKLAAAQPLALRLRRVPNVILPVHAVDQHVVVGPVRTRGVGPCLVCTQLHYGQVDGMWNSITMRFPAGPLSTDPTVIAAGVAAVSAQLRRSVGPRLPPGITHTRPAPGEVVVADPFATPALSTRMVERHPKCPVCSGAVDAD